MAKAAGLMLYVNSLLVAICVITASNGDVFGGESDNAKNEKTVVSNNENKTNKDDKESKDDKSPSAKNENKSKEKNDNKDGESKTDPAKKAAAKRKELALFEDLPQIISASRHSEPISLSSVPVSVITADDIHYSGVTNIPELFYFTPGVDVVELDRNRYAVGVHGMFDYFSDRTLTMINGRNAESPIYGGAEYLRYPLFLEDIDRIEVVRGPGGAAWGANAFNGVINIITKKPEDVQGIFATSTVDQYGETTSQARWASHKDNWSWRTSIGYQDYRPSESVIDDPGFVSRDYAHRATFDGEADYKLSDQTRLSFGTGYQYAKQGDYEFLGYFPAKDSHLETVRSFAKFEHNFDDGVSGYLQWFGNFSDSDEPSLQQSTSSSNDLETQLNFNLAETHHFSIGGNVRWTQINTDHVTANDIRFANLPDNEFTTGAFAVYRWETTERLNFEAQLRGDEYTPTGADWSGRVATLYALDESHHHILRLAGAKSFRAPYLGLREIEFAREPIPPNPALPSGGFALHGTPGHNMHNEEVYAGEIGYTGQWHEGLTFRLDGYFQRYQRLIGFNTRAIPLPIPLPQLKSISYINPQNISGADGMGADMELSYKTKLGQISGWYSYNDISTDARIPDLRSFPPAKNKAGVSGRLFLPHDVVVNANYRYTDLTKGDDTNRYQSVPPLHMLDASVSKKINNRFEVMAGVNDIINKTHEAAQGVGTFTEHETPGRTVFMRFQLKF